MDQHQHWRSLKEWRDLGLPFSTANDEACKLYDAALTQYASYHNDPALGGLPDTLKHLTEADSNFVMGHVITIGLELIAIAKLPVQSPDLRKKLNKITSLTTNNNISDWEKKHIQAIEYLADGFIPEACAVWEEILVHYPLDMLAIKFAFDMHIYLGSMVEMRDILAYIIPEWKPDIPLYSCLMGFYSFCLCETNLFRKGETFGKKGLELNPNDGWATHSLVHIYEMEGRYDDGIQLLESTVKNWEPQDMIACHNYWHWAVYKIEKADYEGALDIFDSQVFPRTSKGQTPFNISDSSSLLRRLEMEGVSVGDRWPGVHEVCQSHMFGGNNLPFYDVHYMMSALGAKQKSDAVKILGDIKEFIQSGTSYNHKAKQDVGAAICESLLAYDEGDSARAVQLLNPVRYQVYKIGGSIAQRDIVHQFLIHAAMDSPNPDHNKLASVLLAERKALVETSQLTERLIQKSLETH